MIEFLKNYLINNYVYIHLITAFVGLFFYKKFKNSFYKYFIWLLFYTLISEIVAQLYGTYVHRGYNQIIVNIFNTINFLFLFRLFYEFAEKRVFKKFISVIVGLYLLTLLYEVLILNLNYHENAQVIPFMVGGLGVLVCVLFYFYQILNSSKLIHVNRELIFWISAGYFLYFLAYIPFKIKQNYFSQLDDYAYLFKILILGGVIKSILLVIGFIWSKEKQEF